MNLKVRTSSTFIKYSQYTGVLHEILSDYTRSVALFYLSIKLISTYLPPVLKAIKVLFRLP